jgi:hypothetical protein
MGAGIGPVSRNAADRRMFPDRVPGKFFFHGSENRMNKGAGAARLRSSFRNDR